MNLKQAATALELALNSDIPAMLWGQPGAGKSDMVRQVAEKRFLPVIDIRLSQCDPSDLKGIPTIEHGKTVWSVPSMLPDITIHGEEGILFFDEINGAPSLVLAAAYQIILDRQLGEYQVPTGWRIVAAGNRETDRGVTTRMPTPLANRFLHVAVDVDAEVWIDWALANSISPELIAFIRLRPELIHAFDPKSTEKAFTSPRTLEYLDRQYKSQPPKEIELEYYAATVGLGTATEFCGFLGVYRHLPDLRDIEKNPDTAIVPAYPAALYALSGALARFANAQRLPAYWRYVKRLPPEFTVLAMHDTVKRHPELMESTEYVDFAASYTEVQF